MPPSRIVPTQSLENGFHAVKLLRTIIDTRSRYPCRQAEQCTVDAVGLRPGTAVNDR